LNTVAPAAGSPATAVSLLAGAEEAIDDIDEDVMSIEDMAEEDDASWASATALPLRRRTENARRRGLDIG
jgi:hypothetical protein